MARQREILAQRMAFKTVIRQNPPQIRVIAEEDAVEVVGFALEPASAAEHSLHGWNGHVLIRRNLYPQPVVLAVAKQVVDHLEPLFPLRIIDAANIDQHLAIDGRIIPHKPHRIDDQVPLHPNRQLVAHDFGAHHRIRQASGDMVG